jgi:phosphoglucomutase
LAAELGPAYYARIDAPETPERKVKLASLIPEAVKTSRLAGDPIIRRATPAGNIG